MKAFETKLKDFFQSQGELIEAFTEGAGASVNSAASLRVALEKERRARAELESEMDDLKKELGGEAFVDGECYYSPPGAVVNLMNSRSRRTDARAHTLGNSPGVRSVFDGNKSREYDSYWNWVVQDALDLHLHVYASVRRAKGWFLRRCLKSRFEA